jgi:four helix bundle protein
MMPPYERLAVWRGCHELAIEVYRATRPFPKHELYGLTSQARRASFSAPANIAEGSGKRGVGEFRRFLDIAIGSLTELSYTLYFCKEVGLLPEEAWIKLDDLRNRGGFLTWRLYKSLDRRAT